jgi:hypothetical protein
VVLGAFAWRLATGRTLPIASRTAAGIGAVVVILAIGGFAAIGPLRSGWSHRSGTSSALLAQLAARNGATAAPTGTSAPSATPTTTVPAATGSESATVPSVPFTSQVTGAQTQTQPDSQGVIQVTLSMHLQNASSTPFTIVLVGQQSGGGVSLSSGTVTFGPYHGTVTGLNGGTVTARVQAPGPVDLVSNLQIDQQTGALSGSVTGTPGGNR